MEEVLKKSDDFRVRRIDLSDIYNIVKLYRTLNRQEAHSQLGADFGIPLKLIEYNDVLVAYSSKIINADDKAETIIQVNANALEGDYKPLFDELLKTNNCFENGLNEKEISKTKYWIERFVSWLNSSEV